MVHLVIDLQPKQKVSSVAFNRHPNEILPPLCLVDEIICFVTEDAAEEREFANKNHLNIYTYLNELALESEPGANGLFFFIFIKRKSTLVE